MRRMCWLLCVLCLSVEAGAQDRLSWEVQQDSGGGDTARGVALSGGSLVMVGNTTSGGSVEFVIRALARDSGVETWRDRVPACCGSLGVFVASHGQAVFAAGYVAGAAVSSTDLFVRAYDTPTGALLWENIWDTGQDDLPQGIAASQSAVVVVGYGGDTPGHSLDFIVRAYDPLDGDILWENRLDRNDAEEAAWTVAIDRDRVFVAGTTLTTTGRDLILRAYNLSSGSLIWERGRPMTSPVQLEALGGRVFVAGSAANRPYLAAFEGRNGGLLWEDAAAASGFFRDIAGVSGRVVAVGTAGNGLLVRAYEPASGTILWQDRPAVAPGFGESALTVALDRQLVYVAGHSGRDLSYSEVLVRAYRAGDGALLWDDRSHRSNSSGARDMVLGQNDLFVTGSTSAPNPSMDFLIRAYDIRGDRPTPAESPTDEGEKPLPLSALGVGRGPQAADR